MRRIIHLLIVFSLVAAACGDDATASPTVTFTTTSTTMAGVGEGSSTSPPATTGSSTTTSGETTTTTSGSTSDAMVCTDYWPEDKVMDLLGGGYTLDATNPTICLYTNIPNSVIGSYRMGSQSLFDQSRAGASLTGDIMDLDVCEEAWVLDLGNNAFAVGEGLRGDKIFNATVSLADSVKAVNDMLAMACSA